MILIFLSLKSLVCFSMDENYPITKFNLSTDDRLRHFTFELIDDQEDAYYYTWDYEVVVSEKITDLYYQKLIKDSDRKNSYYFENSNIMLLFDSKFYYTLNLSSDQEGSHTLSITAHRNTVYARNLAEMFKSKKNIDSESFKGVLERHANIDYFNQKDILFNYIDLVDEKLLLTAFSKLFNFQNSTVAIRWTFQVSEEIEKKIDEKKYFKETDKWSIISDDTLNLKKYSYLDKNCFVNLEYKMQEHKNKISVRFVSISQKNQQLNRDEFEREKEKIEKIKKGEI